MTACDSKDVSGLVSTISDSNVSGFYTYVFSERKKPIDFAFECLIKSLVHIFDFNHLFDLIAFQKYIYYFKSLFILNWIHPCCDHILASYFFFEKLVEY